MASGTERVALVSAADLVGRRVLGTAGILAGTTSHILIDPTSGAIRYLLLATPGAAAGAPLAAIPWARIAASPSSPALRVSESPAELAAAPWVADLPARFVRPEIAAQLFDFGDGVAGNSASSDPVDAGDVPRPAGMVDLPKRGRAPVTAGPPVLVSASALYGIPVARQDGTPLGEIMAAMLDLGAGHLAYLLVAEGSRAAPQAFLPVPMGALVPTPTGYAVAVEDFWLRQVPRLAALQPPGSVGNAWLAAIYRIYGLPPYRR